MALTDNLTAYWKLDDNSNDSVASSNGTNTNISYVAGIINNCATFNGSSSRITVADNAATSPTGDFSVQAWINTNAVTDFRRGIVGKYKGDGNKRSFYWNVKQSDGVCQFAVSSNGSGITETSITLGALTADTWYHFVVAYTASAGTAVLYVNGSSAGTYSGLPTSVYDSTALFTIGDMGEAEGNWWNGEIDEVGLWKRTLSSGEVTSLYNAGSGLAYPFSASGPANLKTWNQVATASIKSINGVPIANVKSINGLA